LLTAKKIPYKDLAGFGLSPWHSREARSPENKATPPMVDIKPPNPGLSYVDSALWASDEERIGEEDCISDILNFKLRTHSESI
jgi:hypothetical protein